MNQETAIRIAALHDGEISGPEKSELLELIERDPQAKAYWDELMNISNQLDGAHVSEAPGSARWGNVQKRMYPESQPRQENVIRFPKYATAIAAAIAVGIGIWLPLRNSEIQTELQGLDTSVYMVETELENATPVVYIDEPSGWTVIWVVEQDPVEG